MKRLCRNCEKEIPAPRHGKNIFCSYECRAEDARKKYLRYNPFKGTSTATTGAISELKVAVDLLARGYNVFRALSPSCPCDLAVLKNGKLLRIEVRTCHISTTGKVYKKASKGDDLTNIDLYAWVLPDRIIYEPELTL